MFQGNNYSFLVFFIKAIKIWFCYCCWVMSVACKLCCCSCIWLDRSWKHASHCLVVGQLEPVCLSAATSNSLFLCSSSFLSNQYLLIFSSDNQLYQLFFFLPQLLLSIPTTTIHHSPIFSLSAILSIACFITSSVVSFSFSAFSFLWRSCDSVLAFFSFSKVFFQQTVQV